MRMLSICAGVALSLLAVRDAPAQSNRSADLAAGKMLVASRDLPDPNFAETVILLVDSNDDGVLGLILNRRSKLPISHVLADLNGAKKRSDPIYSGGPVSRTGVLGLLRSHNQPENAKRVCGDVYLVSTKDLLEKTVATTADASTFHVYVGYAGWTEGQLEHEVEIGAWYIFQGDPAAVFDSDPDSLWRRLIRQTELRIASVALFPQPLHR